MQIADKQYNRNEIAQDALRIENLISMLRINLLSSKNEFDALSSEMYGTKLIQDVQGIGARLDQVIIEILRLPKDDSETPKAA